MQARAWLIVAVLAVAACGGPAPPGAVPPPAAPAGAPDAAARAAAIEAGLAGLQKVDGTWQRGADRIAYSAYYANGELRFLEERVTVPGGAPRHNRYYFTAGRLFYFDGAVPAGKLGGGGDALAPTLPVRAEFQGARTLSAVRLEHYGAVPIGEPAAAEIRRQAAEIATIAASEQRAEGTLPPAGTH